MSLLESAVLPLDAARRAILQTATKSPVVARIVGRRDLRLACLATLQVSALFLLAVRVPVALFFLGPIALGVAHLGADVRYLAIRGGAPRGLLGASLAFAAAITAVRAAAELGAVTVPVADRLDVALGVAWIAVGLAAALGRAGAWQRAALGAAPFACAAAYLVAHARAVGLVMVHAHNVLALVAWLLLFRRRASWTLVPIALVAVFGAVLLSGVTLPWTFARGGMLAFGTHIEELGAWMAPGVPLRVAVALATSFVFLQGVHYAVWTGWIPQDALRGEGTPSFRQSTRSLVADLGRPLLAGILVTAVGLAGLALWDVRAAVSWYLSLSRSHGWFECAFLAYALARRAAGHAAVSATVRAAGVAGRA